MQTWTKLIATIAAILLVTAACGGGDSATDAQDAETSPAGGETETEGAGASGPIVIPVVNSTSGAASSYGGFAQAGLELAVEEINANGGINGADIQLEFHDDGSDPTQAVRLVSQVVDDALVVIGPTLSSTATPALPRCKQAKVACFAVVASNAPAIRENAPWAFSGIQPGDLVGERAVSKFLEEQSDLGSAGAIVANEEVAAELHASGMIRAAEDAGLEVNRVNVPSDALDVSSQVTNVLSQDPDVVFVVTLDRQSTAVVQELRDQGHDGLILVTQPGVSADFIDLAGDAAEGVFAYLEFWAGDPALEEWRTKIEEMGAQPDIVAGTAYDVMNLVAEVMRQEGITAGPDDLASARQAIRDGIADIEYEGLQTTYTFGPEGVPEKPVFLLQVEDGKFVQAG